ncbi:MAG: site-specific DNA-methyltransferase [Rhodoferax sp.]|uniref:site-specific DNA-methyltransferase n=1 Tax=Rhodoferax sp. TaxID=50421 RepID=UPI001842ACFF|nr:site-specific DNA-methyltransferase [Rhodoferax sp.]NMM14669.1 site-specific DNA-methyltransferase [Rhodoferax sp.]
MQKLKLHSPDITQANIDKLAAIADMFPNCVTESLDSEGQLSRSVDFDQLRQELSSSIVEGPQERYQLNWPGKREALLTANAPIAKTLRPCRAESVDFDTTKNLFIEGDNLDALKLLQETYLNKVKLIYIDPPYNTGNDFIYADDFAEDSEDYFRKSNQKDHAGNRLVASSETNGRRHSDWLSMMYSRLKLARNLLRDDGLIIISIDENEVHNLRRMGEEIFGEENFAGEIIWKNSSKNDQAYISIQHEYLLFFVKTKSRNLGKWEEKKEGIDEIYKAFEGFKIKHGDNWREIHSEALSWYKKFPESNPIYSSKHYSWMDGKGVYFPADISGPNVGQYVYDIEHPITKKTVKPPSRGWFCPKENLLDLISKKLVHFGDDETTVPCLKIHLKETEYKSLTSILFKDGRAASKRLKSLFGLNIFTNPKDESVLTELMKAVGIKNDDLVIDFFAGSATTGHSVLNLNMSQNSNCRFILIQLPEDLNSTYKVATGLSKKVVKNAIDYLNSKALSLNICEISKERLRLSGSAIVNDPSGQMALASLDIGFRVLKIDNSNMNEVYYTPDAISQDQLAGMVDNIRADRTSEDLLFQVLLDWGVDLALPIAQETIAGKPVFFVDGNALAACFETDINEDFVKLLAKRSPLRAVFRDAGFSSDSVKINVEQIFKLMSPSTEVKTI